MSNIYLTSDTHFSHINMVEKFKLRPFESWQQMDEQLITNWNEVVKAEDTIYHLGDVCFQAGTRLDYILPQLRGKKYLIQGNHDYWKLLPKLAKYFSGIYGMYELYGCIMTHIPIRPNAMERWKANLHGHLHLQPADSSFESAVFSEIYGNAAYINLNVELTQYKPISLDCVLDEVNKLNKEKEVKP